MTKNKSFNFFHTIFNEVCFSSSNDRNCISNSALSRYGSDRNPSPSLDKKPSMGSHVLSGSCITLKTASLISVAFSSSSTVLDPGQTIK